MSAGVLNRSIGTTVHSFSEYVDDLQAELMRAANEIEGMLELDGALDSVNERIPDDLLGVLYEVGELNCRLCDLRWNSIRPLLRAAAGSIAAEEAA